MGEGRFLDEAIVTSAGRRLAEIASILRLACERGEFIGDACDVWEGTRTIPGGIRSVSEELRLLAEMIGP